MRIGNMICIWSSGYEVSGVLLNLNDGEINDTLSNDDEMSRISAAIWDINRVLFDENLR